MAQERRIKQMEKEDNIFQIGNDFQLRKPPFRIKQFYDKQEHKYSIEDIPLQKQNQKQIIKEIIEPDVLELRKRRWESSTSIPVHKQLEEPHERKLWKIKLGLADGHQVKYKPYKEYEGVETRDSISGWNPSTFVQKNRSNFFQISTPQQLSKNIFVNRQKQQDYLPVEYRNPKQRQNDYVQFMRDKKKDEIPVRDKLRDIYVYDNPGSSQAKINAGVFRLNYETKLKAGQLQQIKEDINYTFTPDISKTIKRQQYLKEYHTGQWSNFPKIKSDGNIKDKWAYSCCLKTDQNSPGCNKYVQDKLKWNLAGYTNN